MVSIRIAIIILKLKYLMEIYLKKYYFQEQLKNG